MRETKRRIVIRLDPAQSEENTLIALIQKIADKGLLKSNLVRNLLILGVQAGKGKL
jgi:hypothetical protein